MLQVLVPSQKNPNLYHRKGLLEARILSYFVISNHWPLSGKLVLIYSQSSYQYCLSIDESHHKSGTFSNLQNILYKIGCWCATYSLSLSKFINGMCWPSFHAWSSVQLIGMARGAWSIFCPLWFTQLPVTKFPPIWCLLMDIFIHNEVTG